MRLADRRPALAQRLDLGAAQHEPGLEPLLDRVVVERAPVLRHDLALAGDPRHRRLSSRGRPRPAPRRPRPWPRSDSATSGRRTSSAAAAEPAQRVLGRCRAGLAEQRLVQRHQPAVQGQRLVRPARRARRRASAAHRRGATLAVTEMQPWPPCARNARALASSPESWQNSAPQAAWVSSGRTMSAVESLTPTMLGSSRQPAHGLGRHVDHASGPGCCR